MNEDLRCPHCNVIILRRESAAAGIPVPDHCARCGERVELHAVASQNVPSSTHRREPGRP